MSRMSICGPDERVMQLRLSLCPLQTRCDEPPRYQKYDCPNDCADETSAFASFIPSDRLAEICCCKSPNDSEQSRENKSFRFITCCQDERISRLPPPKIQL